MISWYDLNCSLIDAGVGQRCYFNVRHYRNRLGLDVPNRHPFEVVKRLRTLNPSGYGLQIQVLNTSRQQLVEFRAQSKVYYMIVVTNRTQFATYTPGDNVTVIESSPSIKILDVTEENTERFRVYMVPTYNQDVQTLLYTEVLKDWIAFNGAAFEEGDYTIEGVTEDCAARILGEIETVRQRQLAQEEEERQAAIREAELEEKESLRIITQESLNKLATCVSDGKAELYNVIDEYRNEIVELLRQVRTYQEKIKYNQVKIDGMVSVDMYKPLKDYLQSGLDAGYITAVSAKTDHDNIVHLAVQYNTTLSYWDMSEYDALETHVSRNLSKEALVLLRDIIRDRKHAYKFKQGVNILPFPSRNMDLTGPSCYNPHIGQYDCFGNNSDVITKYLGDCNYEMALAVVNNTVIQLNLTDYIVCDRWLNKLTSDWRNEHCLVAEDGTLHTPQEVIDESV